MALIVQKFGGSSVADVEKVRRVAGIIADTYRAGNDVIVVLSAQGKTTDGLIAKALEYNPRPSKREMDMLLSTGEQQSVALCAMMLESMGIPAVSLTGWQVEFRTNSNYSNASIKGVGSERIRKELDARRVVLVTGFQGINKYDDITTLGRGGSDTSAVAIAAVMHADLCQIYTDVDGVYTADPNKVKGAKKLNEITFDEMLELASMGAKVLHNRSVEMAKRYNVDLEVLSSYERLPGTKVREVKKLEQANVSGVAKDVNVARLTLVGIKDEPGIAFRIFHVLAAKKINVDIIIQSLARDNTQDITFTVGRNDAETAEQALNEYKDAIGYEAISVDTHVAKVSIVGSGMLMNSGIAVVMFDALASKKVNIQMISTSEIKVSVLVDEDDADKAVQAIHDKFFGD
ncbi:MAG: aspartate kinase [Oscillospiraceae bacterium]